MIVDEEKRERGSRRLTQPTTLPGIAKKTSLLLVGFLGLQAVLFLLLVAGQAVPDKPIVDNLVKAIDAGTYGPAGLPDRMGGVSDTFTECVVVGTGLGSTEDDSAWEQAGYMPRISNCEKGGDQIRALAAGEAVKTDKYYKYWAGYTAITRPVLALAGMEGVRIVSGALLLTSIAAVTLTVARRVNWWAASALLAPLLLASNVMSTPSTSFSHSISISLILFSSALAAAGSGRSHAKLVGFVALGAALFCFVDLLTTPAIPWALAAAVSAGVTMAASKSLLRAATAGTLAAIVWPVSFALTWASRWVISAAFLGWEQVMGHVATNVEFRTGGAYRDVVSNEFGASTLRNANYWWDRIPTSHIVVLLTLLAALFAVTMAVRRNGLAGPLAGVILGLPILVIPTWYEVLRNHSQIHDFFAYRGVPVGFGIGLFALVVAASVHFHGRNSLQHAPLEETIAHDEEERAKHDLHR